MASLTRGATTLAAYMYDRQLSSAAFAKLVPCSQTLPWMWAHGRANPSRRMAYRIERVTGGQVTRDLWDDSEPIDDNIKDMTIDEIMKRVNK